MLKSASILLSRMMLAARAGMQFDGARDLYQVLGYPRLLTAEMMYEKFLRQDIACTVVSRPAEALWTAPPTVSADPEFTAAWDKFASSTRLWTHIMKADILLGMEPYTALYIGAPGDPRSPATGGKNTPVLYLNVFAASSAVVSTVYEDVQQPTFGSPKSYNLSMKPINSTGIPQSAGVTATFEADASRVVHMTNETLIGDLVSPPRMQKGYNLLEDMAKVAGGSAETFWLVANRGMQVDVDKDMELTAADAQNLEAEVEEFQHQLRRVMRTRGVTVNPLGSDPVRPAEAFNTTLSLLSATYRIPQRILVGAEAGQLASAQDRANWAEAVQDRRKSFAEPYILDRIIAKAVSLGALPTPKQEIKYEWPDAFRQNPLERAQTMAQFARAVVNMSRQSQFGSPIATTNECRKAIGLPDDNSLPSVEEAMQWILDSKKPAASATNKTKTDAGIAP